MSKDSRRTFPTFTHHHLRRAARPLAGFDCQRTADSWLAAELADELLTVEVKRWSSRKLEDRAQSRWSWLFEDIRQGLNASGWQANIDYHLHHITR
jgi:hypothetical protein